MSIVFYVEEVKRLKEIIYLIKILKTKYKIYCIVPDNIYLTNLKQYDIFKEDLENIILIEENKSYSLKLIKTINNTKSNSTKLFNFLMQSKDNSIGQLFYYYLLKLNLSFVYKQLKAQFKQIKPSLVIGVNDRSYSYIEHAIYKVAQENNIHIFLPFVFFANPQVSLIKTKNIKKYNLNTRSSLFDKYIFNKFKDISINNQFFYTAYMTKAFYDFGTLPKYPWLVGGGISTSFALPNKLLFELFYKDTTIDQKKINILGDLSYIPLYQSYHNRQKTKTKIFKKYNLQKQQIVIISLQDLYEHQFVSKEKHTNINETIIQSCLTLKNYNILISIPPNMQKQNYTYLEDKYNITILDERLMEILPIANLYIGMYSTTIYWSVLCGIKTILLDTIIKEKYDKNLFLSLKSIQYITDTKELQTIISKLETWDIKQFIEYDYDLLSRDKVFNNNIAANYLDYIEKVINGKD